MWNVVTVSLRQRIVPDALLGRLNASYRLLAWGTQPIGALLGGLIGEALGLQAVFLIAGVIIALLLFARAIITDAAIAAAEREGAEEADALAAAGAPAAARAQDRAGVHRLDGLPRAVDRRILRAWTTQHGRAPGWPLRASAGHRRPQAVIAIPLDRPRRRTLSGTCPVGIRQRPIPDRLRSSRRRSPIAGLIWIVRSGSRAARPVSVGDGATASGERSSPARARRRASPVAVPICG